MNEKFDVLVIGAGPSGSMAAAIARCMDSFEEAGVLAKYLSKQENK